MGDESGGDNCLLPSADHLWGSADEDGTLRRRRRNTFSHRKERMGLCRDKPMNAVAIAFVGFAPKAHLKLPVRLKGHQCRFCQVSEGQKGTGFTDAVGLTPKGEGFRKQFVTADETFQKAP